MAEITIYGVSDFLIEVDGAIDAEFSNPYSDDEAFLAFSDGTVLSVECIYWDVWRVNRVAAGSASYSKTEALDADMDDYTDRVTLTGDIAWVVCGSSVAYAKENAAA